MNCDGSAWTRMWPNRDSSRNLLGGIQENNEHYLDNRRPGQDKKQVIFRKQVTAAAHYNHFVWCLLFLNLLNVQLRVYTTERFREPPDF
jgi:hypothetical protein